MHIQHTNTTGKKLFSKKTFSTIALGLFLLSLLPLGLVLLGAFSQPTGNHLSPLPQGQLTQASPTITPTNTTKTTTELVSLSQSYLNKAINLSQHTPQSDSDKQTIISHLEQSLDYSNQAVLSQPNNPQVYLLRAQILTSISQTNPLALDQAQQDLETASQLANGQQVSLPQTINPFDLLPSQQASLPQDLIVAAPQTATSSSTTTDNSSNASTTSITLPAGQTQLQVDDPQVQTDSYIYLIPQQKTNQPVYVSSKSNSSFTVTTNKPLDQDLVIDYWIINH